MPTSQVGDKRLRGVCWGEGPIASLAWLVLDDPVMGVKIPAPETGQPSAKENSHKKEPNCDICRDMDGPRDYHTDRSKSEREKQIAYINAYMQNLEKWYR